MKIRSVTGATLVVVVLAALAGCAASDDAPAARPSGVTTTPTSADEPKPLCVVRSSLAPSTVRPSDVISRGTLVAGVDPSDATMSHWDADTQQFEGFNIDLLVEVARAIWPGEKNPRDRITFRVVRPGQSSFDTLNPVNPEEQRVDIIATSLTATCKRAETVRFSNNYLDSGQTALVRRKEDGNPEFAGMEALGGRRVCAAAGTTSLAEIAGYRTSAGERPVPVQAPHSIDCLVMLRQGQVDAVSTDENILIGFAEMAPDTMLVTEPPKDNEESCEYHSKVDPCTWFTDEPHAFAFRKEDIELTAFVNHVLESPRVADVWEGAHRKWLTDTSRGTGAAARRHPDGGRPTPGPVATP